MDSNKISVFSDIKWNGNNIGLDIGAYVPGEKWQYDLPTRSNIEKFQQGTGKMVPLFGDSMIFGHGIQQQYTIEENLSKLDNENCYINFAQPGSSNTDILMRLEQWINTYDKSPVMFVGLTDGMRAAVYYNTKHNDINHKSQTSIFDNNNQHVHRILSGTSDNINNLKLEKGHYQYLLQEWRNNIDRITPVTILLDLQSAVRRLYWISRATNTPIYYWMHNRNSEFFNDNDKIIFKEQLDKLEQSSKLKRIDIDMPSTEEFILPDLHWNNKGTKLASDIIWKHINVHL